jgi:TonB family protein
MSGRSIPKCEPAATPLDSETETNLAELAAFFSARSGDQLSTQLSVDLALEIVLNEIVEQACSATGATGAAVMLARDSEMVCRATSGITAPELGSRLDSESGLTAECMRTHVIQRCDDALLDPLADAEASRNLGVRSVIVVPLLHQAGLAGVLEVFSSSRAAFSNRDEGTLRVLGQRILKNLDAREQLNAISAEAIANPPAAAVARETRGQEALAGAGASISVEASVEEIPVESLRKMLANQTFDQTVANQEDEFVTPTVLDTPKDGINPLTLSLAAACMICALLIVALVAIRATSHKTRVLGAERTTSGANRAPAPSNTAVDASGAAFSKPPISPTPAPQDVPAGNGASPAGQSGTSEPPAATTTLSAGAVPAGGLVVYDNGQEIFRMLPGTAKPAQSSAPGATDLVELSAEAAAASLLHRVEPEYPEEARQQRLQGPVVLQVHIGRDGSVESATQISGQDILGKAAVAAVRQWRFKPHLIHGQPVPAQTRIILNFRMAQ